MTSAFRKGTVPFSLRENRESPQVIFPPVLSLPSAPRTGKSPDGAETAAGRVHLRLVCKEGPATGRPP